MKSIKAKIKESAKRTAALFFEEFGAPLDPAKTDWDATAWNFDAGELRLSDAKKDRYWDFYQSSLVSETYLLYEQKQD